MIPIVYPFDTGGRLPEDRIVFSTDTIDAILLDTDADNIERTDYKVLKRIRDFDTSGNDDSYFFDYPSQNSCEFLSMLQPSTTSMPMLRANDIESGARCNQIKLDIAALLANHLDRCVDEFGWQPRDAETLVEGDDPQALVWQMGIAGAGDWQASVIKSAIREDRNSALNWGGDFISFEELEGVPLSSGTFFSEIAEEVSSQKDLALAAITWYGTAESSGFYHYDGGTKFLPKVAEPRLNELIGVPSASVVVIDPDNGSAIGGLSPLVVNSTEAGSMTVDLAVREDAGEIAAPYAHVMFWDETSYSVNDVMSALFVEERASVPKDVAVVSSLGGDQSGFLWARSRITPLEAFLARHGKTLDDLSEGTRETILSSASP